MTDSMHQPRGGNGQYVSLDTLFERERVEHNVDHERERRVAADTASRLEREVENTARRLERMVEESALRLEKSVAVALNAVAETAQVHATAHDNEHKAHERIHQVEKDQVEKAAGSVDKRLEGMNEFRDTLTDQAGTFVSRELFDATIKPLTEFRARAMGAAVVLTLISGTIGALVIRVFSGGG